MRRLLAFSSRNTREILRDPLNLAFLLGFPLVLMMLLTAIQANIPVSLFELDHLTPGITVFGLSFLTLFSATLVSRDRETALLQRLYTTPMTPWDFIIGYTLPILPMGIIRGLACYLMAMVLGLPFSANTLYALLTLVPVVLFYIGMGLLCGSVLNSKQVGGLCGALLTNLSALASGIWFDLELVGGAFRRAAFLLPFAHAVELCRAAFQGSFSQGLSHLWWVLGYAAVTVIAAVALFLRQMKRQ